MLQTRNKYNKNNKVKLYSYTEKPFIVIVPYFPKKY